MQFRFIDPVDDFTDGMQVLRGYHEDFLERGKQLLLLVEDIHNNGMNESSASRCIEFHSYYTRANRLHHQDEEAALFPLIINQSFLIDGMIERLTLDHEEIEESWNELAVLLSAPEKITGTGKLQRLAREFEKLQREHLLREDEDFLDQVEALLSSAQCIEMGKKMAALRGIKNLEGMRLAV